MAEDVSLDQLRTFLMAVDEGSFSAAARRLQRAQSVVSATLANLESRLGLQLFDRSSRLPALTESGRALVERAREVIGSVDHFQSRADDLVGGVESELSIAVDMLFPIETLSQALAAYQVNFPDTPLRVYLEGLGAIVNQIIEGRCVLAITGSLPTVPPQFTHEQLMSVEMMFVVSSQHPLGRMPGPIPPHELAQHTQLILTDRSKLTAGQDFGVISGKAWRIADISAKLAFIRAGLGWGSAPVSMIRADLESGSLVRVPSDVAAGATVPRGIESLPPARFFMPMFAVHRTGMPPGRAGRWLIEHLKRTEHVTME